MKKRYKMINKIKNKLLKKKVVDFTNDNWKSDALVGKEIITRPWKRLPFVIAMGIFLTGILPIMNFVFSTILASKFLYRFG